MRKSVAIPLIAGSLLVLLLALAAWAVDRRGHENLKTQGRDLFLGQTSAELDANLRRALPLGSSRQAVEAVLRYARFDQHYDPQARIIHAAARNVKGSNWLILEDFSADFQFDNGERSPGSRPPAI